MSVGNIAVTGEKRAGVVSKAIDSFASEMGLDKLRDRQAEELGTRFARSVKAFLASFGVNTDIDKPTMFKPESLARKIGQLINQIPKLSTRSQANLGTVARFNSWVPNLIKALMEKDTFEKTFALDSSYRSELEKFVARSDNKALKTFAVQLADHLAGTRIGVRYGRASGLERTFNILLEKSEKLSEKDLPRYYMKDIDDYKVVRIAEHQSESKEEEPISRRIFDILSYSRDINQPEQAFDALNNFIHIQDMPAENLVGWPEAD